jgi:polysaccharide biosynthesis transport protein
LSSLTIHDREDPAGGMPYRDASYYPEPVAASDGFGINDLKRIVQRNRLLILMIMVPVTLATLIWQLTSPTLYQSTVSAKVELIDDVGVNQAEVLARNSQRVANEVKLYRSRSTAERVVRDLRLDLDPAFVLNVGGISGGTEAERISNATSHVLQQISVAFEVGSDQIEVAVTSRSPELAAKIANQIPASVRSLKNAQAVERRAKLLASLEQEQTKREKDAADTAQRVADFRREHRLLVGGGGVDDLQQVNRIAGEVASAAGMRAGSAAQSAGVVRASGIHTATGLSSPVVQHLQRQEADLSAELARLSQTYGSRHPEIVRINGQLDEVRRSLASADAQASAVAASAANAEGARMAQLARSEASRDAARANQLEGILATTTRKAFENTSNSVALDQLSRSAELSAKALNELTDRISQVRAQMQQEGVTTTVVSPAVANHAPVAPRPLKLAMFAFLGSGLFGLLLAFTREIVDDKLRTAAQIRRLFGLPTFGMLPLVRQEFSRNLQESPVLLEPHSLFAEVARATYAEVQALGTSGKSQSVVVTSPLPNDGKSIVALTLASAAVAAGKRAVVLDLDLRKAGILQQIQRDRNSPDLLEVLRGNVDLQLIAPRNPVASPEPAGSEIDVDVGRLALLSVSKPVAHPSNVINSRKLAALVDDLKSRFDLVVINAPPTLTVRDAITMCDFSDHTVIVARWGQTTIDQMRATLEMLNPERVEGIIFSQVDYPEHARRVYGDSIQYYFDSSDYYSDDAPRRTTLVDEVKRMFTRRSAR